jgi:hypothetical protein
MRAWGPPLRASEMMRTERRLRKYSKMLSLVSGLRELSKTSQRTLGTHE